MEWLIILAIIGSSIYWLQKRRTRTKQITNSSSMTFFDGKLDALACQIHEDKIKSEKLAQITYLQWKADREREKRITLATGVTLPRSQWSMEQDRVFAALEHSTEQKHQLFLADQRREAGAAEKVAETERTTAELVKKALEEDTK